MEDISMTETAPGYGLWSLVFINSAIFIFFAFSFFKPQTKRDWRSFGAFSAFLVALFTEMYGFPLTIYLLSGWLQANYPGVDWLSHDAGHLLEMLFGWKTNPHWGPFHILSMVFIGGGFWLLSSAWRVLYAAQTTANMAKDGPYARIRHPQYVAFILIMFGFLLQWPTILTLLMFPVLVYMYIRLARYEEKAVRTEFGAVYDRYAAHTPAFLPELRLHKHDEMQKCRYLVTDFMTSLSKIDSQTRQLISPDRPASATSTYDECSSCMSHSAMAPSVTLRQL
jgi:protein-S-isoprenylcysteine O-methyltransferase Ste14